MEGYVKLSRKVTDWEHFKDDNCLKVFIFLLVHSKFEACDYAGYHFEPGDVRYTYEEIANKCGITVRQTRTAIAKLKATGILTSKATSKFSIGSLEGWANCETGAKKMSGKMTSKRSPSYNYKENKEEPERRDFGTGGIRYHV